MRQQLATFCGALAVALAACGEEPGSAPEEFEFPYGVYSPDFVELRWLPPRHGDLTGYELDCRVPGGEFTHLATYPASTLWATVNFRSGPPDAAVIELRLRAQPDPRGDRTATLTWHRPIRRAVLGVDEEAEARRMEERTTAVQGEQ